MADESILTYKKPGFPKFENSEKSYRTTIEYVGPQATLAAAEPGINAAWGDYIGVVTNGVLSPIEGTTQAELTITVEYNYDGSAGTAGSSREVTYEVEWVMFQRSLLEHPKFRKGGGGEHELNGDDIASIEAWKTAAPSLKKEYQYYDTNTEITGTLSAPAQMFAKGLELGLESYEDYAPIVRRTTTYAGGPPGNSTAGLKDTPPNFSGKPSGYEWRKTADRGIRAGGQTRWERIEEWAGAEKVLISKTQIYFT